MDSKKKLKSVRDKVVTEVQDAFSLQVNPRNPYPYTLESTVDLLMKVLCHRLCDKDLDAAGKDVIDGFWTYMQDRGPERRLKPLILSTEPFAKFVLKLTDPEEFERLRVSLSFNDSKESLKHVLVALDLVDNKIVSAAQKEATLGELEKYGPYARHVGTAYYLRNFYAHRSENAKMRSDKKTGAYFQSLCIFFVYTVARHRERIEAVFNPIPVVEKRYERQQRRLVDLDKHQRNLAVEWINGHRIIKGPSGTGKTTVLIYKAQFLLKHVPQIRNVLFLCYNITLANYIKRLLGQHKVSIGQPGIEVYPFYEFCAKILERPVAHQDRPKEYYDQICAEALARSRSMAPGYDAIMVDEVQDFSDDMLRVVVSQLNPQTDNLTLALDENQNIYNRRRSWKQLGINAVRRTHWLKHVYRPTDELYRFSARFIDLCGIASDGPDPQRPLFVDDPTASHGPLPEVRRFDSMEGIIAYIAETIHQGMAQHGYPPFEFAVLYSSSDFGQAAVRDLPERIKKGLEHHGILANWISKDFHTKNAYDVTTQSVTISSIHSVKGFDYSCVFLVGADTVDGQRWSAEQAHRLGYVAITRVRDELHIPYVREAGLVRRFKDCLPDGSPPE